MTHTIPTSHTLGDTLSCTVSDSDYPATTHTAKLRLIGPEGTEPVNLTSAADGSDHNFTATAAVTTGWVPGVYTWVLYVNEVGGTTTRYQLATGTIELLPDPMNARLNTGHVSHARQMVDAIEAALLDLADNPKTSVTVAGHGYTAENLAALRKEHGIWKRKLALENGQSGIIRSRFSGPQI